MDRAKKAEVVESLNGLIGGAGSVVVAHYSGMTVAQMSDLRSRMSAAGASFKVSKNRLAVRALQGTAAESIAHLFKGPTGIAFSADPIAASKVAVAYAKDNEKLVILGGVVGTTALDANGVKALAALPSLDDGVARCARDEAGGPHGRACRSACPCDRCVFHKRSGLAGRNHIHCSNP
jgi:large subunit ribosomal protein L10